MLWHIELWLCILFSFNEFQIKIECHQFSSFCRSYSPFGTSNTGNTQFSALFSNMLGYLKLKLCIWLCFNVLQIKCEFCQFTSIFVRVMPLLDLRILEIHSFSHSSPTCFDILSYNFVYGFHFMNFRSSWSVINFLQFCRSCFPFGTKNTGNAQFSAFFFYMLWHIELKFCIWPSFNELKIKWLSFLWVKFEGVMPHLDVELCTFLVHALKLSLLFFFIFITLFLACYWNWTSFAFQGSLFL